MCQTLMLTSTIAIQLITNTNKIDYTIVKNDPEFYMQVTPMRLHPGQDDNARQASFNDAMALARQLKLSITDVKLRFKKHKLSPKLTEEYIKTYTIDRPDTFMFTHHEIRTIPINPGANPIQQQIAFDAVPETIWVTLVDKKALIGTYDSTPFQTYPFPNMRNPLLTTFGTTGYPVYVFVQTLSGKEGDGIFYED